MKNNGPVYNITTGKLDVPINDHMAVDMEGHMTFRIGEHNSYSPTHPSSNPMSNPWDYNNQPNCRPVRNYSRAPRRNAGPSKAVMTFLQGIGVLAVIGVMAALYYYGFGG